MKHAKSNENHWDIYEVKMFNIDFPEGKVKYLKCCLRFKFPNLFISTV